MSEDNTSKEQKKICSEALKKPESIGNKDKQQISGKGEDLKEYQIEIKSNKPIISSPNNSTSPMFDEINIEDKELYQINNFLR